MGVKLLLRPLQPKGVTSPAPYDVLKWLVDEICASQISSRSDVWLVTCQLMKQGHSMAATVGAQPASGGGSSLKDMWAVTFRDAPEQVFLLQRPEYKVLECDAAVTRLIEKKLEYTRQMTVRFEGHTYSKGDFVIRLCTATQAIHATQALLGYCLELEYLPLRSLSCSEGMMGEFVDLLKQVMAGLAPAVAPGGAGGGGGAASLQLEVVKPAYDKYGLANTAYGRSHTAVAYTDLAMILLSSNNAAQPQQQQPSAALTGTVAAPQQQAQQPPLQQQHNARVTF